MGPPFLSIQTAFNKAEEDIIFRDLHNSQITQKKNPIISLLFIQKFVILKPVVFVLFLLCFKALFWLFPASHNSRNPLVFLFPAHMFSFIFRCRSVIDERFPNLVNGSYFLCRISWEISANQK